MSDDWTTNPLPFDSDANDLDMGDLGKGFLYEGRAYTPAAFDQHVHSYNFGPIKPDYLVLHHTAVPSASWARYSSGAVWDTGEQGMSYDQKLAKRLHQMELIRNYYRDTLHWDRGPHLFIDDLAIYTFTPMAEIGIHAAQGNRYTQNGRLHYSIGIEVVGYYTHVHWPEPVLSNVAAAVCSLKAALGNFDFVSGPGAGRIAEHRMYNKPSCPGDAIHPNFYMPRFKQVWQERHQAGGTSPTPGPSTDAITAESSVLAAPRARMEQALAYMLRRPHGEYTEQDLRETILPAYWQVCTAVGVDPLLVVAQLIHETGNLTAWWAARPQRNPAGLGVTGQTSASQPSSGAWVQHDGMWHEGLVFKSWQDESIPAHVGRLLAYALRDSQANGAQQALIAKALAWRGLPDSYRGCAPTWHGLNGRWAVPGTTYAEAIANIATAIAKS